MSWADMGKNEDPIDNVTDRVTLAKFVGELSDDLRDKPDDWQNVTLERFLEAMHRWLEDMGGLEKNLGIDFETMPKWKFVAYVLAAARIYE